MWHNTNGDNNIIINNNNNALNAFKVADEINSRLFNHRPFLQGEMSLMMSSFDETPMHQQVIDLLSVLERSTDMKETQLDAALNVFTHCFHQMNESLDRVSNDLNHVLDEELLRSEQRTQEATHKREERKQHWITFIDDIQSQVKQMDDYFTDAEKQLNAFYNDLEHKLRLNQTLNNN